MRLAAGARVARRARPRASWSPRLMPASAWTSSMTMARRVANRAARVGQGEHHGEALGRGEQHLRRTLALAAAAVGGRVAGAGLDGDRQAHLGHGREQVAGDVGGERLQRADVERVQAGGRGLRQRDQAGEKAGERLAAAGGGDQERALAGRGGGEDGELVRTRGPAAGGEPGGEGFRDCSGHRTQMARRGGGVNRPGGARGRGRRRAGQGRPGRSRGAGW